MLHLLEAPANLRRPEATVSPQRADRRDLAGPGPAGHRLGIDPEKGGYLGGSKECICLRLFSHGSKPLELSDSSSRYGTGLFGNMARMSHLSVVTND